jgi:hypothetical protein
MRPGERAWVYIMDFKYGYGEKGSFSFPSVPPACQLVYDVTMVTCEAPDEVGPHATVQQQQQLQQRLQVGSRAL